MTIKRFCGVCLLLSVAVIIVSDVYGVPVKPMVRAASLGLAIGFTAHAGCRLLD